MSEKIVAMIPARLGSQRVKMKNLRLINGKPLISYIVKTAMESDIFDGVYINSEAEIFKDIADYYGVKFYKRPEYLASNSATNDDFAFDFIENVSCDILIQLLTTSPFISLKDIREFVTTMKKNQLDTLISVKNEQIEAIYKNEPLNFKQNEKTQPSQTLTPVQLYACGIMGWKTSRFKQNMKKFSAAYHGGDGKTGYFELKGISTLDIDKEEDFQVAETVILTRGKSEAPIEYYSSKKVAISHSEIDVLSILKKDGVIKNVLFSSNKPLLNIEKIISTMPKTKSWSKRIVNTENNSATLICQLPGEGNRLHYHSNWNEWWYIVEGTWNWEVEGRKIEVRKGDIVFIEKGKRHKITAQGNCPAIRLAVSREDVAHIYPND